ncbi:MAG: hypothetical protein AB1744_10310, partial [Candidatus Zixiibacteriota bacterium]
MRRGIHIRTIIWPAVLGMALLAGDALGRARLTEDEKEPGRGLAAASPYHCIAAHQVGKIVLAVNNNGTFGNGFAIQTTDCFTGQLVQSCEYPKRSNTNYLYAGAFWIGAVVGRDTLVSVGADGWRYVREMFPDEEDFAIIEKRSIIDPTKPEFEGAISEEDYVFVYTDTFTQGVANDYFGWPYRPLNIRVTQNSYAWSYSYAEDFVLFDYQVQNMGQRMLENVYMGLYVDADVCFGSIPCTDDGFRDDICGFLPTITTEFRGQQFVDTVNIAWIADGSGDLDKISDPESGPTPHVTAMRIVRTPSAKLDVSFNWWISNGQSTLDFGPREKPCQPRWPDDPRCPEWKQHFRDFRTGGLGTPEGDVNKYYLLRNKEFDYDQVFTAIISPSDPLWYECARGAVTQEMCENFADGFDTRYLLSFGPFDIDPGQRLPVSFAYVAGEDFHTYLENAKINLPYNPNMFYDSVHFEDLGDNAIWASWIYDNPGVDTDNDGYSGKYRTVVVDSSILDSNCYDTTIGGNDTTICEYDYAVVDTQWYEGDGVPDFRGASPPPAPRMCVTPSVGALHLRFNGMRSETTRDVFSQEADFEGYRVYIARDERAGSYSVVTSYDLEDYNKFVYNQPRDEWTLNDVPFTLEELRCLYGDSCNDPF